MGILEDKQVAVGKGCKKKKNPSFSYMPIFYILNCLFWILYCVHVLPNEKVNSIYIYNLITLKSIINL